MYQINLNCDLGESFGSYTLGMDKEVIPYITSANIACGFHASDPLVMQETVALAIHCQVEVGAHPGFPDLVGFGRRNMDLSPKEVKAAVLYQMGALDAFCKAQQTKLVHVKPHGALYNMAAKNKNYAEAISQAIYEYDSSLIFLGLYQSEMIRAGREIGLRCANEVFADRAYENDGTLVARSKPGSVITDEDQIVKRVLKMVKQGVVTSIHGIDIPIEADSICVHGDNPQAITLVSSLKKALENQGVVIAKLSAIAK